MPDARPRIRNSCFHRLIQFVRLNALRSLRQALLELKPARRSVNMACNNLESKILNNNNNNNTRRQRQRRRQRRQRPNNAPTTPQQRPNSAPTAEWCQAEVGARARAGVSFGSSSHHGAIRRSKERPKQRPRNFTQGSGHGQ